MGEEPQTLEEAKHDADLLESKRISGLHRLQKRAIILSKLVLDKTHEGALKRDAERINRITSAQMLVSEIDRHGFEWVAGDKESWIQNDAKTLKFIADKRAGKHI